MRSINAYYCSLNIRYDLPDAVWETVGELYERMPGWIGYVQGIPHWFGQEEDGIRITASVEPSGLCMEARMDEESWQSWIGLFKTEASKVLGFKVAEPEDER
ncbi:hypothetical protein [Saccharibacillus qingshengii]|uniref:hypothetical protein n=1 Tax=Saccharibacillus qingshengii TaxID=1763540 RepID=UPI001552CAB0|nr:hypothetical protein [Saccharibacillus qingshengii]